MEHDLLDLGGQVAIVTGAGQNAGRATALELARHNAGGIAVNDFVAERAEAVAAEIRALGVPAMAAAFDVCDLDAVKAADAAIKDRLGAATILVNNAGMAGPGGSLRPTLNFWEEDPANWPRYLGTNLYGVYNCCFGFIPNMVEAKRGRIVTIVSDSGRIGEPRLAVYASAKAGAQGFVRSIAKELGRYGVTCNAVSLSSLMPDMPEEKLAEVMQSDHAKAQLSRYTIRRYGKSGDVAALVTFLCSDAASWITGQTYPLNGGYAPSM
ncbi:SDR family NAD(P)-dependent oxidoreductase [Novosphingobium album (ex Liu et al. 2023)]|uniref:SDR family oxidoreductase n=1 Tax=Novosphingobium album (ex Liu et al. 2023) TaxID=3031130 RepID=A0ABT5WLZ2_9SPHN|nr:SDR family oxidoreductase [Novosphingobium album (ex Liu et al. 2023)]MDE8651045.1 SDR family oxidoreductase [Novosphingobium album (ex Liu et al. 2023)]